MTSEATGRFHLPVLLSLSDRSRIDLRWVNGDLRWRYRNRLKIERTFRVKRLEWTPYSHAEAFYSLDQSSWTRIRYAAGTELALSRRIVLEGYFSPPERLGKCSEVCQRHWNRTTVLPPLSP